MKFIRLEKTDLSDNEALNIFYALKSAGIINGDEYYKFQKRSSESGVHLSILSKQAKIDYIKSLDKSFFKRSKIYADIAQLSNDIYNRSLQNNGSTTFLDTGLAVTTGYLVAGLKGAPSWIGSTLTPDIIEEFINKCYEDWFKNTNIEHRYYLGTWLNKNNNKWYLDVSHDAGSETNAINLCKERGEQAYYDMLKGTDIYIDSI